MALPPIVQWWNEQETAVQSQWDAGPVDAGSESTATTFHLWNNKGNSVEVADMINVDITVRDKEGRTTDLAVAGGVDAIVKVQFFDSTKAGGSWGVDVASVWTSDAWADVRHDLVQPVISTSGLRRRIKGSANVGDASINKDNYASIKLKLYAKPTASAGAVEWLTRISYQYS